MIKSLHGSKTEIHPKSVEACLILQNYFEDELIKTFGADKRVSTHERFCKFILNFYNSDEIDKIRDLPELHYRR